ncbi:hypothetical protein T439DRAFT_380413 [Meredithblackwellia eburnea MCA 4105]
MGHHSDKRKGKDETPEEREERKAKELKKKELLRQFFTGQRSQVKKPKRNSGKEHRHDGTGGSSRTTRRDSHRNVPSKVYGNHPLSSEGGIGSYHHGHTGSDENFVSPSSEHWMGALPEHMASAEGQPSKYDPQSRNRQHVDFDQDSEDEGSFSGSDHFASDNYSDYEFENHVLPEFNHAPSQVSGQHANVSPRGQVTEYPVLDDPDLTPGDPFQFEDISLPEKEVYMHDMSIRMQAGGYYSTISGKIASPKHVMDGNVKFSLFYVSKDLEEAEAREIHLEDGKSYSSHQIHLTGGVQKFTFQVWSPPATKFRIKIDLWVKNHALYGMWDCVNNSPESLRRDVNEEGRGAIRGVRAVKPSPELSQAARLAREQRAAARAAGAQAFASANWRRVHNRKTKQCDGNSSDDDEYFHDSGSELN